MKKGLLGSTAIVGTTALMAGTAGAAEAPTWKLSGNMNFQGYYIDQDFKDFTTKTGTTIKGSPTSFSIAIATTVGNAQDHAWYFGVDESELQLNVSGTADNGLNYGFKIEINANTTDNTVADEARLQFSGSWGTLQMGDEDGAEDIMNYGGENLMGATGGFDGDFDDVLIRAGRLAITTTVTTFAIEFGAPSYPSIAGDTGDATKISYFSPRFAGFQVGASLTPQPGLEGDDFKQDGALENHYGLGANYDNSFGGVRVRASAVYSAASQTGVLYEDISAWSVGGIVGFGPVSVGANYTDNGDSGSIIGLGIDTETSYWNAAAAFETGPLYLSGGYFESTRETTGQPDQTFSTISLTADYSVAPGLGIYAEYNKIEDELKGDFTNDANVFIVGANVSF